MISIFAGSIGIFCSSVFKKTLPSIIVTLVIELAFVFGTLILYRVANIFYMYHMDSHGIEKQTLSLVFPVLLVANPAALVTDYLFRVFGPGGIFYSIESEISYTDYDISVLENVLIQAWNNWMIPSILALLGVSLFLVKMAANKIDPLRKKNKKRK